MPPLSPSQTQTTAAPGRCVRRSILANQGDTIDFDPGLNGQTVSYSAAKSNTDTYVVTVPHTYVDTFTYSETYT